LLVLLVVLVGLVEAVSCIREHHVQKLLEEGSMEIVFQVLPIALVYPKGSENFVGVKSILELLVKLVGSASHRNHTVESDESES
jgi:hypothetical protein